MPTDRKRPIEAPYVRRLIFVAAALFMPTPFVLIVVGGLVPLAWTLVFFLRGAIVAIPKGTAEGLSILAILLAHLLVIGGALYLLSALAGRLLCRLLPPRSALLVAGLIAIGAAVASFFDIYRLPGHHSASPVNLVGLLAELAK